MIIGMALFPECQELWSVMSCSYKYFSSFLERQWETIILVNSAGEITKTMDIKFSLWCYNVSRWPTLQWTAHCTNCARECIEMPVDKRKCLEMVPGTCKVSRRLNDIWQMIWDLYACFYSSKSSRRKAMSHYFFVEFCLWITNIAVLLENKTVHKVLNNGCGQEIFSWRNPSLKRSCNIGIIWFWITVSHHTQNSTNTNTHHLYFTHRPCQKPFVTVF